MTDLTKLTREFRSELDPGVMYVREQRDGGRFLYVDETIVALSNRTAEELITDSAVWDSRLAPDDAARAEGVYSDPRATEVAVPWSFSILVAENDAVTSKLVSESFRISSTPEHGPVRVGRWVDISELGETQRKLTAEKERLELVLFGTRLGLWDWNMQTGETTFNERWAEIVGYTLSELEPVSINTWMDLANSEDLAGSDELIESHARGEAPYYDVEARMRHKDGHWVWVHDRGRIVEWTADGRPLRMTGTHEDITVRKLRQRTLEKEAETDPLTGLGNRRLLEDQVRQRLETGSGFGLLFFDLDHFKAINDTLGHVAGDEVLRKVAEQLRAQSRPDDRPIRYAGDEFIVLIPDTDPTIVTNVAARIRDAVGRVRVSSDYGRTVGVSAGVVISTELSQDQHDLDAILALADQRLYRAKATGGDTLFSSQGM